MQNADAECIADANCIAELQMQVQSRVMNCFALKRLARQKRWAGFNRSRAFRRAWGVGLRALGQGTPTNMAWDLGCRALGEGAFSEET